MFTLSGGLLAGQHDSQKERSPPSRPAPVTFPSLTPPSPPAAHPPSAWTSGSSSGIPAQFLSLRKPSDVSLDTLATLNISFQPECDFETLFSSLSNYAEAYLPPTSWLEPDQSRPSTSEPNVKLLSNGRRAPDRNEFYVRAKELLFSNNDAFSNLTRKASGSHVPLRLAHFRKFWEGLDNMAYYWDNSHDEYLPPRPESATGDGTSETLANTHLNTSNSGYEAVAVETETKAELITKPHSGVSHEGEPRKKAKTEASSREGVGGSAKPTDAAGGAVPLRSTPIRSSKLLPARTAPLKVPRAMNMDSHTQEPIDLSQGSYKGYRIGNGAEMPDQYRLDCVRSFLEPITWAFGVTLVPHRRPPVLLLQHVRFPVRMNSVAWRGPQDRIRARQGWMEGPVLGIQCRPDIDFGSTGNLQAESILDAVRELGGLLLLAQERSREGKTEKRGGEGRWWTTRHRWGGGPGGEVGEATNPDDTPLVATPKVEEKPSVRSRLGSKDRRRPTPAEVWKVVRHGNPLWDPKVVYEAIGKDHDVEWDDVFMVSSVNHHISVLRLRVHPLYLQYLAEGVLPEHDNCDQDWCCPQLQRTRWFDLFDIKDRTEAMRGLWGVTAYLMRSQDTFDMFMNDA